MSSGTVVITTLLSIIVVVLILGFVIVITRRDDTFGRERSSRGDIDRLLHHFTTVIDPYQDAATMGIKNETDGGETNATMDDGDKIIDSETDVARNVSDATKNDDKITDSETDVARNVSDATKNDDEEMEFDLRELQMKEVVEIPAAPIISCHRRHKKHCCNGQSSNTFQYDAYATTSGERPQDIFRSSPYKQRTLKLRADYVYMVIIEILAIGQSSKKMYSSKMQYSFRVDSNGNVVVNSPTNLRIILVESKNWIASIEFEPWTMNIVASSRGSTERVRWLANIRVVQFS